MSDRARPDRFLAGRAAIVTGGASGLGRGIALRLAAAGADLCLLSLGRTAAPAIAGEVKYFAADHELAATAVEIEALGVRCLAVDGDTSAPDDVQRMVAAAAARFGRLDVLVCNAATNVVHQVLGHDDAAWLRVLMVNLYGSYLCARAALPHMVGSGWGRIIAVGSTNAHVGTAEYSAYAASKHGLLGFVRSLALEVAPHGITANTVSPAMMETPSARLHIERWAADKSLSYEQMRERFMQEYPLGRFVDPQEVAAMIVYLCRDEAQAINGEDVRITTGASF